MAIRKRNKHTRKLSQLSFGRMVPNLATLLALFVGLAQIKFALQGQWKYVLLAVLGAAFFDVMDGRLARMLNVCSRFGAELDSLSDLVVFGVCPAVVLYLFSLSSVDRIGWVVCAFFAICMALRLARFNVSDIENISTDLTQRGFSVGVPAPAGAILNLFPIVLYNAFKTDFFKNPYFGIVISIATSLLCVSKIPTFTIKKLHIKRENYMVFLLYMIVFVCTVFVYTWKMFSVCILAYVASMFVSNSKAKILSDKSNE